MMRRPIFAACAALALTGSGAVAAPVASAQATATMPFALTRTFLIGRWTDSGNCTQVTQFLADGNFQTYQGASGRWALDGNQLTLQGAAGALLLTVVAIDRQTLTIYFANGASSRSQRC